MTRKQYTKAPIVEAVVDLQTEFADGFSLDAFGAVYSALHDRFPTKSVMEQHRVAVTGDVAHAEDIQVSQRRDVLGLRLSSKDNTRILQLRSNGFTYNCLPPYPSWEVMRDAAYEAWLTFVDVCKPKTVVRCALRYINRIEIPLKTIEMRDYFRLYPEVPTDIPQSVTGMFLQLQMPQTDLDGMAIINQAGVKPNLPDTVAILLDIDLFQSRVCARRPSDLADARQATRSQKRPVRGLYYRPYQEVDRLMSTFSATTYAPRLPMIQRSRSSTPLAGRTNDPTSVVTLGTSPGVLATLGLQESKRQLAALQNLPENWDGFGSARPDPTAIAHASFWLDEIYLESTAAGFEWSSPHITASESGETVFEWWHDARKLTLYFGAGQDAEFIKVWGPDIEHDMADGPLHAADIANLWAWLNA